MLLQPKNKLVAVGLGALALGLALGAGAVAAFWAWAADDEPGPSSPPLDAVALMTLSDRDLTRRVLQGYAEGVVHVSRAPDGITFFRKPRAVATGLCAVETLATETHRSFQSFKANDLKSSTRYGFVAEQVEDRDWTEPAQIRACAGYSDFDHLFTAPTHDDPVTGASLLARARAQARAGRIAFPTDCGAPSDRSYHCDAHRMLADLDLKTVSTIDRESQVEQGKRFRRVDVATTIAEEGAGPHGAISRLTSYRITSTRAFAEREWTILSISITTDTEE